MLDSDSREQIETGFISGSQGQIYYRIDGADQAKPLVMVHGATVASWEFDLLLPRLLADGFKILRFDLYGHGRSARPRSAYELNLFIKQCREVLSATRFPADGYWLGHSMGAAICSGYLKSQCEQVEGVVLMAPMLNFSRSNPFSLILNTPYLGVSFMSSFGQIFLKRRRRRRYALIGRSEFYQYFLEQTRVPGFWRAMSGLEKDGALGDQTICYQANRTLAESKTTVLWGSADQVIPREDIDMIRHLVGAPAFVELEDLEHNLMLSHPELVSASLLQAFNVENRKESGVH